MADPGGRVYGDLKLVTCLPVVLVCFDLSFALSTFVRPFCSIRLQRWLSGLTRPGLRPRSPRVAVGLLAGGDVCGRAGWQAAHRTPSTQPMLPRDYPESCIRGWVGVPLMLYVPVSALRREVSIEKYLREGALQPFLQVQPLPDAEEVTGEERALAGYFLVVVGFVELEGGQVVAADVEAHGLLPRLAGQGLRCV